MNQVAANNFKKRVRTYEIDQDYGVGDVVADAFFYAETMGWNPRDILRMALGTYEARKPNLVTPVLLGFIRGWWVHRASDMSGNVWYCRHQKPVFLNTPADTPYKWSKPRRINWRCGGDSWGRKTNIKAAKPITIQIPSSSENAWQEVCRNSGHNAGMNNNSTVLIYSDGTVWYEYSPENVWHNLKDSLDPKAVLVHMVGTWYFSLPQIKRLDEKALRHNIYLERKWIAERLAEKPDLAARLGHVPLPGEEEQPEVAHLEAYTAFQKTVTDLDEEAEVNAEAAIYFLEELRKVPNKSYEDYLKES